MKNIEKYRRDMEILHKKNLEKYGPEYEAAPDHDHTCGECVRFTENWRLPGVFRCQAIYGPGDGLEKDRKACKNYWDRAEQEAADKREAEEREAARLAAWERNKDNPPRPPQWETDYDEITGQQTGAMPFCPNCGEPLYEPNQCYFCGQPILRDKQMDEFEKPPEVETTDCFRCGGKGTVRYARSKYNGHKSGGCTACGMRFIE